MGGKSKDKIICHFAQGLGCCRYAATCLALGRGTCESLSSCRIWRRSSKTCQEQYSGRHKKFIIIIIISSLSIIISIIIIAKVEDEQDQTKKVPPGLREGRRIQSLK